MLTVRIICDLARRIRRDYERVVGRTNWRKPVGVHAQTTFIRIASRGVEDGKRLKFSIHGVRRSLITLSHVGSFRAARCVELPRTRSATQPGWKRTPAICSVLPSSHCFDDVSGAVIKQADRKNRRIRYGRLAPGKMLAYLNYHLNKMGRRTTAAQVLGGTTTSKSALGELLHNG